VVRVLPVIRLSVLDILWPGHLPRLVKHLDDLGYHRFWATEHHSTMQSASPTLAAGLAAALTGRIRVGTAGVLLNYASPAKVAEDFRLLELYFSGRIDLGVAGAIATAHEDLYLDGRPRPTRESYAARVRTLVEIVRGEHAAAVGPRSDSQPELWLCGTSRSSAELAGSLGMRFAFHRYLAGSSSLARDAIAAYRDAYSGPAGERPYAVIASYGACAETEQRARQQWSADAGKPCFLGTPTSCIEQLLELQDSCDADEVAINLYVKNIDERIAGYALIADAARLDAGDGEIDAAATTELRAM
jgi:luciferase family oxidoreductase group 1